jgi:predicted SAM-dependent methyltransferase
MLNRFKSAGIRLLERFGYRLEPVYKSRLKQTIPAGAKLYVGCGDQVVEGYYGCDLRDLPTVSLACRAWEISSHCNALGEIYSRHMLEHLSLAEMRLTLQDWLTALTPNGVVRIEVPNLEFAIAQLQRAVWTSTALDDRFSDARWGLACFFGWQRECDPQAADYNQSYWDVHKSGYTADSMRYFLEQAGFAEIEITFEGFSAAQNRRRKLSAEASANCHLIATARKPSGVQPMAT